MNCGSGRTSVAGSVEPGPSNDRLRQSVDELNRSVVMHEHLSCQIADHDLPARRRPHDQKSLVLLRGHTCLCECRLAERQEPSHREAEAR